VAYKRKTTIKPTLLESSPEIVPGLTLAEVNQSKLQLNDEKWQAVLEDLPENEQVVLQTEGEALATAMLIQGFSRLAIGAHLIKVQAILEPHGRFGRFLRRFRFTARTAYRYIQRYENASANLPDAILKAAMLRGIDISGESPEAPLGKYTTAAKRLPPPSEPTPDQAATWLDQVVAVQKAEVIDRSTPELVAPVPQDPDTLLKECYRFVSIRYKKLPIGSKVRSRWVHQLTGMLMTELGVSHPQPISPIAVPDDFRVGRGRPPAEREARVA
jgi:hypothetical protein